MHADSLFLYSHCVATLLVGLACIIFAIAVHAAKFTMLYSLRVLKTAFRFEKPENIEQQNQNNNKILEQG